MTLCMIYCKSLRCDAILFVELELYESFMERQSKNTELGVITSDKKRPRATPRLVSGIPIRDPLG